MSPKIKFSHHYAKISSGINFTTKATLMGAYKINLEDQHKKFISYDTDNGKYKLPEQGEYLMLLFLKPNGRDLFTTLRRYTQSKYEYYFDLVGQEFDIVIKE